MHTGKFTLTSEYGTTNIKRTKRFQVEQSDEDDFKSKSRVKWIDDCNYVLFDDKLIRGPEFLEPKAGEELYVEILSIEANMVKVKTTANFIDLVRETTMLIVK